MIPNNPVYGISTPFNSVDWAKNHSGQADIRRLEAQIKSLTDRLPYKGSLKKRERFAKRIRAKQTKLITLKLEQ